MWLFYIGNVLIMIKFFVSFFILSFVICAGSTFSYEWGGWFEQKVHDVSVILEQKIQEKWDQYRQTILELLWSFERKYDWNERAEFILDILIRNLSWRPTQPNILLIIADDLWKDATPWFIPTQTRKAKMPHLEELMEKGVSFDNVRSSPVCTPTRGTMLTGKFGVNTSVLNVDDPLSEDERTLHKHITDQTSGAYASTIVGKWHLWGKEKDPGQLKRLWISDYVGLLSWWVKSYDSRQMTKDGTTQRSTEYITIKITDEAIDWITEQDSPRFAWVAYTAPHTPFHLPPLDLHTRTDLSWTPEDVSDRPVEYFLAMVESLDTEMWRLLDQVDLEETIVIFVWDNGTSWRVAQAPYESKRSKWSLYQGWIDVPLVISGPWVVRKGMREDALITLPDMFPTISELIWIDSPSDIDGVSFAKNIYDSSAMSRDRMLSEIEKDVWVRASAWIAGQTVRNERYKLIVWSNGTQEMFDLISDPYEMNDLLGGTLTASEESAYSYLSGIIEQVNN